MEYYNFSSILYKITTIFNFPSTNDAIKEESDSSDAIPDSVSGMSEE